LELASALADFTEQDRSVADAIDRNDNTGWAIKPELGKPHFALFALAKPVTDSSGAVLRVILEFKSGYQQHALGRFRLSVSGDPADFDREEKRLAVAKGTDLWTKLAIVYHMLGDQSARRAAQASPRSGCRHRRSVCG
jgi:hypothetical protein